MWSCTPSRTTRSRRIHDRPSDRRPGSRNIHWSLTTPSLPHNRILSVALAHQDVDVAFRLYTSRAAAAASVATAAVAAICYEAMTVASKESLACSHSFCRPCLDRLFSSHSSMPCPLCRSSSTRLPSVRLAPVPAAGGAGSDLPWWLVPDYYRLCVRQ